MTTITSNNVITQLLDFTIPEEYKPFLDDIMRVASIQITIQFLYYMNSNGVIPFFYLDFFFMLLYIILGVCVYWMIIKKLLLLK
jgi:hypothetical protein